MIHSLFQDQAFTCRNCKKSFEAEIWIIVDIAERPDLVVRVVKRSLHVLACPNCGTQHFIDAPLLIYRPGQVPALLFSPAEETKAREDRQQVIGMIGILRQRLGSTWRDEWLEWSTVMIPRAVLPVALTTSSEEAIRQLVELVEQSRGDFHPREQAHSQNSGVSIQHNELAERIQNFVTTRSWQESYRQLKAHPELASQKALEILEHLAAISRAHGHADAVQMFEERLTLLLRSQEIGEEAAFKEKLRANSLDAEIALPQEVRRIVEELVALDLAHTSEEDLQRRLEEHPDQRVRLEAAIMASRAGTDVPAAFQATLREVVSAKQRYEHARDLPSLDVVLMHCSQIVHHSAFARTPASFQLALVRLTAALHLNHYDLTGHLDDLERAILLLQETLEQHSVEADGTDDLSALLALLGKSLHNRYDHTLKLEDLEQTIKSYREAVHSTSPETPDFADYLDNLATGLRDMYVRRGQLTDLEEAISVSQEALQHAPVDSPQLLAYLTNLGNSLRDRFEHTGNPDDLKRTIEIFYEAVRHTPADSPALPRRLTNLGTGLYNRYKRFGQLIDIDEAVRVWREAASQASVSSHRLSDYLSNLGIGLSTRYEDRGDFEDLEQAIEALQLAVKSSSPGLLDLPDYLFNLGHSLRNRFERDGRIEYLEQAIALYREAIRMAPPETRKLAEYYNSLASTLNTHFTHTGQLGDLEQAILESEESLRRTIPGSTNWPYHLNTLATGLYSRYRSAGRQEYLEQAIHILQNALQRVPDDSPAAALILYNLSTMLKERNEYTGQPEDVDQAIEGLRKGIHALPPHSPRFPAFLNSLGTSLLKRYSSTKRVEDLEEAIETLKRAVQLTPVESLDRIGSLNDLGKALRSRYTAMDQLQDLEAAITLFQDVVREIEQRKLMDTPTFPICIANLALSLADRYDRSGQNEDLEKAMAAYGMACEQGLQLAPRVSLECSRVWGNRLLRSGQWSDAARAYSFGIRALEHIYRVQLSRVGRENSLSMFPALHIRAAYALARCGRPREAASILEHGRARNMNEVLARDNAVLDRLRFIEPEIYAFYQQAAERLRELEKIEQMGDLQDARVASQRAIGNISLVGQIQQAREDLERAIARIQQLPGYERFLQETTFDDISNMVQTGVPLVYLATTPVGSMALLVQAADGMPEVIWLDSFIEDDLIDMLIQPTDVPDGNVIVGGYLPGQFNPTWLRLALDVLLPRLGNKLIKPLADRLRSFGTTSVVLIPTGILGLLPLHAATYQVNDKQLCLLDEFHVGYIPSARVLEAVRRELSEREKRSTYLVAVANPLPDKETGEWAQGNLKRIVSALQLVFNVGMTLPPEDINSLPEDERDATLGTIHQLTQVIEDLHALSKRPAEALIGAGEQLQNAFRLFHSLSIFPDNLLGALFHLLDRIPPSLHHAREEVSDIMKLLPGNQTIALYEQEATQTALWDLIGQATIAHFACHADFNPRVPLESALHLARGTRLTLRDLLNTDHQHLAGLNLVFLSACQTSITDFQRVPDEVVGLLAGFLQAGVPSVIGTLWSVDDLSTTLLTTRFYELYLHGDEQSNLPPQTPVLALRLAQQWLRAFTNEDLLAYLQAHPDPDLLPRVRKDVRQGKGAERPYAHPYHWAAFAYYGAL